MLLHVARSFLVTRGGTQIDDMSGEKHTAGGKSLSEAVAKIARDEHHFLDTIWPPGENGGDRSSYWKSYPLETDNL